MKNIAIVFLIQLLLSVTAAKGQFKKVSTPSELQDALNTAVAGQTIQLADGIYTQSGGFIVPPGRHGTSAAPVTVQGSTNAIISCSNLSSGYGISVRGSNYWIFEGFTIYNSSKGIVLDSSHHGIIKNLIIYKIGYEGIHLRCYSSYCNVESCFVDSTGLISPGTAEGIYVGSAVSNWPKYTGGHPDTCNYSIITGNSFGDHVLSENIDIKEGTKGGLIAYNNFNGTGLNNINSGDSWIDVKGNDYTISCNTGANTISDGFQSHIVAIGWGDNNTFSNNTLAINNDIGYGIFITTHSTKGTANNNIVCSNNSVTGGQGQTNIEALLCLGSSCPLTLNPYQETNGSSLLLQVVPNPLAGTASLLSAKEFLNKSFVITNTSGQAILSGKIALEKTDLSLENFPSGIYFFNLLENTMTTPIKIIKY